MKWLQQLPLPGNIRQLKNLVERSVLVSRKDVLDVDAFRSQLELSPSKKGSIQLPDVGVLTLDEIEVQMIKKALEHHQNKISKAAASLGLTRSSLYRRLENTIFPTMKLRTKYILFVVLVHLVALVLSYFIFKSDPVLFIASETLIIISILLAWQLYNQLIQPLKLLMQGTEAIKDRDFNVKFVKTGKYEMDQLISVYNNMIDELRTERTKQEQQHFFLDKLIQTSPTGIIILDYEDNVQQANPKALELLDATEREVIGKSVSDVNHPMMQQILHLKSGEAKTITLNGANTYKLQKSHFVDRGFPRHFVMIEELTAEILAAEKKSVWKSDTHDGA
jgi:transcriptional regulator with PAS, ATPase and Fis domain